MHLYIPSSRVPNLSLDQLVPALHFEVGQMLVAWIVDYGATAHMTLHKKWLWSLFPTHEDSITLGDSQSVPIEEMSTICIFRSMPDLKYDTMEALYVFWIPIVSKDDISTTPKWNIFTLFWGT